VPPSCFVCADCSVSPRFPSRVSSPFYHSAPHQHVLLVHFGTVDLNATRRQTLVIHNDGKHKFFFKPEEILFPGSDELAHALSFVPEDPAMLAEGNHIVVRKKQSVRLHVDLTVLKNGSFDLVAPFALRFASGPLLLATGMATVLPSVFGVDPMELELVHVCRGNATKGTATTSLVPRVLVLMKTYLYDQGGLDVEGIFRIAADEREMPQVRTALNRGEFVSCTDINCISTLIKVFFRHLPQPLLTEIPTEILLNVVKEKDSHAAMNHMSKTTKDLLMWIVELMCDVVAHSSANKMSPHSCAIVMGPNLFAATNITGNPMQALMMSQKAVLLLKHLIQGEVAHRENL
jgi:hypothetical protein